MTTCCFDDAVAGQSRQAERPRPAEQPHQGDWPHQSDWVATILAAPLQLLSRPVEAFNRHRDAMRNHSDLAVLDSRLLTDIGLRRSLTDPAALFCAPGE